MSHETVPSPPPRLRLLDRMARRGTPFTGILFAGLMIGDDGRVVTGAELNEMDDDELTAIVPEVSVYARVSPEHKLRIVTALQEQGEVVAMTGDGVNDAPVLAAADVSMTVKGGAELANSTADLILIGESLGLVATARAIARRARQLIRQNLAWAVLYNASVMPLAVSGMLKPWMAALGMSLSSLLVVANASRLVREGRRSPDAGQALEQEGDTP